MSSTRGEAGREGGPDERTPLLRREEEAPSPAPASEEPTDEAEAKHDAVSPARRILGIVLALTGVFIAGADQSFLMVTYELIASRFNDVSASAWVLTGYNLGYCIALPVYGKMGDLFGPKYSLAVAYTLFSAGCLASGLGAQLWQVIAGRIITGLGGAGMVALIFIIITDNVQPSQVALMRSYVNIVDVSGRSFGGPVGAFVANSIGWRWSFIVQAPTALFCGVFCMVLLSSKQTDLKKKESPAAGAQIDFLGIGGFTVTIASFLAAMQLWDQQQLGPAAACLAVAVAAGLAFLLVEAYWAAQPLIPLPLLKTSSAVFFALHALLAFGRQAHVSSLSPYFLWTQELDTTDAALRLVPSPIGFTAGSLGAGLMVKRTNRYKTLCYVSLALSSLVYLAIHIRWSASRPLPGEWLYSVPAGLGLGAVLACTFTGLAVVTDPSVQSTAICLYYLAQQIGGILGTTVSALALHSTFRDALLVALHNLPDSQQIVDDLVNRSGILSVPEPFREAVRESYLQGFQYVSVIPLATTVLSLLLLLMFTRRVGDLGSS